MDWLQFLGTMLIAMVGVSLLWYREKISQIWNDAKRIWSTALKIAIIFENVDPSLFLNNMIQSGSNVKVIGETICQIADQLSEAMDDTDD